MCLYICIWAHIYTYIKPAQWLALYILLVCLFCLWPHSQKFLSQGLNLSWSCKLHCSWGNCGSFYLMHWARDQTHASTATQAAAVRFLTHCATAGALRYMCFYHNLRKLFLSITCTNQLLFYQFVMAWIISFQKICWTSNLWCLRMWSYLETGSWNIIKFRQGP